MTYESTRVWNTRIAPSPTGDMHLGTARTALFNYYAARASGGKFILRIDDTDADRNDESKVVGITDAMAWLGLDYDEIHRQSDRHDLYKSTAEALIIRGLAKMADNGAILLDVDPQQMVKLDVQWNDTVKGVVPFTDKVAKALDRDIVLMKGDGNPTYHFASVVDDVNMEINWVIRGVDHFTNTHLHVMIYMAMGAPVPRFTHLGLITKDKKKMSKRDGAASMQMYRDEGYSAQAMNDYMMRLGWSMAGGVEPKLLTHNIIMEEFLKGKMRSAPSGFDLARLDNLNRKHKNNGT